MLYKIKEVEDPCIQSFFVMNSKDYTLKPSSLGSKGRRELLA
jgi:hypothetical protein